MMIEGFKAYFPLGIIKVFKFLSQTPERLIIIFSQARSYPENHASMFSLCRDPREVIVAELKAFELHQPSLPHLLFAPRERCHQVSLGLLSPKLGGERKPVC